MIQRQQSHPVGDFLRCSGCAREPAHIVTRGRVAGEPCDPQHPATGVHHALECARCGRSTARHRTIDAAIGEWVAAYAQQALPFSSVVRMRRRAVA